MDSAASPVRVIMMLVRMIMRRSNCFVIRPPMEDAVLRNPLPMKIVKERKALGKIYTPRVTG